MPINNCYYISRTAIAIAVVLWHLICAAQKPMVIQYRQFNRQTGFDINHVSGFSHDGVNQLYLATPVGLYTHNGSNYHLIDLQKTDSSISLLCNKTYRDKHGRIWFMNYPNGWGYYNPATGSIINFSGKCNIPLQYIANVYHDSKGRYWIASDDEADTSRCGLYLFDPVKKYLTQFKFEVVARKRYRSNSDKVSNITEDKTGKLWLATWNGLVCFDPETGKYQTYINEIETQVFTLFAKLHFANDSILIAGSWGRGLLEFNIRSKKYAHYLPNPLKQLKGTHNILLTFCPIDEYTYLVGTLDGGLFVYDLRTHLFTRPKNHLDQTDDLLTTGIVNMYQMPNGNIAVGGGDQGFYIIDSKSFLNTYYFIPVVPEMMHSVVDLAEDTRSNKYLATTIYGGNFYLVDKFTHAVQAFNPYGGHVDYSFSFLLQNGIYFISSSSGGFLFDPLTAQVNRDLKQFHPVLSQGLFNVRITDEGKKLWIYEKAQLYCFDRELRLLEQHDLAKKLGDKYFSWQCAFQIIDNRYFFTSNKNGSLIRIDVKTGKSTQCFRKDFKGSKDLYKDSRGKIWECNFEQINELIETKDGGLVLQKIQTKAKRVVAKFHSIVPIDDDEIYFTSEFGMLRFNTITREAIDVPFPDDYIDYKYAVLPFSKKNSFSHTSKFIVQQQDTTEKQNPQLLINSMQVGGKPYTAFHQFTTRSVSLEHWQNELRFEFAVIGFFNSNIDYTYQLINSDQTPQVAQYGNQAIYNNLKPGIYSFCVNAVNKLEGWNIQSQIIEVNIAYPWWQTGWFYSLITLVLTSGIFLFYRFRIDRIRKESMLKGKLIEADLKALRSQMNPHFIFNSLNSINRYIIKSDPVTASDYLTKFAKLMRLILDNSSLHFIPLEKEIASLQLYVELEQVRFAKKFSFAIKTDSSINTGNVLIQPLLLQPFIENAIWHGLMHKSGDDGFLHVSFIRNEERMTCIIEDNGIGRKQAAVQSPSLHEGSKSQGIDVTVNRLKMADPTATVSITDRTDAEGNPDGTRVTISFDYIEEET
jgi:WD40 repeat protein